MIKRNLKAFVQTLSAGVLAGVCLGPADAQSSAAYRYDALGKLIGTEIGVGATSTYTFDAAGNRVRSTSILQFPQSWPIQSPQIGHIIGRSEGDGWSARVEDPEGHMVYGPYTNGAPAGQRVATFRMMVDNNNADNSPVVVLDVYDATVGTQLAVRQVDRMEWRAAHAYQVFEVPFSLDAARVDHALEFRIYYQRSSYVRVERLGYR